MQAVLSMILAFMALCTSEGYTAPYTRQVPANISQLTLCLHCQAECSGYGYWDYGVSAIDVLDGDAVVQTLPVNVDGGSDLTQCWNKDGDLYVEDLNFDGIPDLRLMEGAGVVNISYLCWLWNPEAGRYEYGFRLSGYDIILDGAAQQIITESRDGWGQYFTDYYAYDGAGKLQRIKQIHQDYAEGTTTTTTFD